MMMSNGVLECWGSENLMFHCSNLPALYFLNAWLDLVCDRVL